MSKIIRDKGQTLSAPTGKVLGIIDTKHEFDSFVQALAAAGFDKVQALNGDDGVALLERVNGFFFSDLEDRVLQRHIEELKQGHYIVAVESPPEGIDQVVEVATKSGARRLVHFGPWQVAWLTQ